MTGTQPSLGGAEASWADLYVVVRAAGRHALPAPLPETLLVNDLLGRCGLEARNEAMSFGARHSLVQSGKRVAGRLHAVPWGRDVKHVVAITAADAGAAPSVLLLARSDAQVEPSGNVAGEARDTLIFDGAQPLAQAPLPAHLDTDFLWMGGAMLRSAQMAGALETALATSVQYATERVQFGKRIGSFQAIQHQLAVMAEHTACCAVAAETAFVDSTPEFSPFAIATARIVGAEAAGIAAGVAHAVHGAIGFTHEHALQHLTRRLWSWRSEFGNLGHWSERLGRAVCTSGAASLWPTITRGSLELAPRSTNRHSEVAA